MRPIIYSILFAFLVNQAQAQKYYGKGYTIVDQAVAYDDLTLSVYKKITAKTVKGALEQLLNGSGWRLAEYIASEPEINRLYSQPYPQHKRKLGPMPLENALVWIAGDAWQLVVDPVNKLISYELSPRYTCFPSTKKVCHL